MKTVNKTKDKKQKPQKTKKPKVTAKKEKVLIVAQQIKFARLLSGNEKKTRDRVLKSFKKWLTNCFERGYDFKEDDFIRVWKGLFYAVWMSDKPLVQEDLCESISAILDQFPESRVRPALLMFRAGLRVIATEWYGIDRHRIDKFLMLVRRYLRGSLRCLLRCEWSVSSCQMYARMLSEDDGILSLKTPAYARNAASLVMHFIECFLEELSKVSSGNIPEESVVELLRPFCAYMCSGENLTLATACRRLLTALVRQSNEGLEYEERTRVWKSLGCPRGGPEALERVSDDEEGNDDDEAHSDDEDMDRPGALDPRAGRVDVSLRPLPAPAARVAAVLRALLAGAASRAHRRTKICLDRFEQLAKNQYPLPVEEVYTTVESAPTSVAKSARSLQALEKTLKASSDELALRGLSRKHRKRLLARARAGHNIVEEAAGTNGNWAVESTDTTNKKTSENNVDTSDKENVHKNKSAKKRKRDKQTDGPDRKRKVKDKYNNEENTPETDRKKFDKDTKVMNKVKKDDYQKQINGVTETVVKENGKSSKDTNKKNQRDNKKEKATALNEINKKRNKPEKINDARKMSVDEIEPAKTNAKEKKATVLVNKVKNYQKKTNAEKKDSPQKKPSYETPKRVKFVLKNNSMQGAVDYYKSVRRSPSIPYDGSKLPSKTNLKVSTPSPINPFLKKKLRMK